MPDATAVRAVHLGDKNVDARLNWLNDIFPTVVSRRYTEADTTIFSSARSHFDTFIMQGDDAERMAKLMRGASDNLVGKVKLALLTRSWPQDRARLLNAGFDDVFDLRMDKVEALARINALHRRRILTMAGLAPDISAALILEMRSYVTSKLTQRESEVLAKLVSKRGGVVSVPDLARSQLKRVPAMSRPALLVFICRLRKKLNDQCSIVAVQGEGYRFVRAFRKDL